MARVVKFLFKIIASPFVLCLLMIAWFRIVISLFIDWLIYGGELVVYDKIANQITIKKVYDIIQKNECTKETY